MRGVFVAILAMLIAALSLKFAAAAPLGAVIDNVATVTYTMGGATSTIVTPLASFTVQARPTPSTIEFFRISPSAPDATLVQLNGADYATDGASAFAPIGAIVLAGGAPVNLSQPLPLTPATAYFAGEPVVVRVTDAGQNGDPGVVETIVATITTANGDRVTLRFYESGPDTGAFYAYIQSASGAVSIDDAVLTVAKSATLTATYVDPFDATEVSTDVAGVDPFGRVFDSATGAPISGVAVTIVDDATGLPATVFGIDGVSAYPSTVTTGATVTDASGAVYPLAPGEFRFPIMMPGRYRIVFSAPSGYSAPSLATAAHIATLPGAPFVITPASYLLAFDLAGTGDVEFDAPVDPHTDISITKEASAAVAAAGDFVRYEISATNGAGTPALIVIRDRLPVGFRYRAGSARLNGAAVADPGVSPDGSTLVFPAGVAAPGETLKLAYVAAVSAGARKGEAVNSAVAINGLGAAVSNIAEAAVFVQEDLLRSNLTIVGRVAEDACDPGAKWPKRLSPGKGVSGVRVYMETGVSALTDKDGLYHFEDVTPRTHVVQIDEASVPAGYDVVRCETNTRFAGSAISQFVDAQGGSLWRANFYLRKSGAAAAAPALAPAATPFNDATEHKSFDKAWLASQTPEPQIVYPAEGRTPSARAINIGVKHEAGQRATLLVNGAPHAQNFAGRDVAANGAALSRWRGVDIGDGETRITAVILDQNDVEIARLERRIVFVDRALRAAFLPQQSTLIADGRNSPVVAVRITDEGGRPVHAGRQIVVKVDPPYRAKATTRVEDALPLTAPLAAESAGTVGPDGVMRVELDPTSETGRLRLRVRLDDGADEEIFAYVKPAMRDWIVVGLAEGTGSLQKTTGAAPKGRDLIGDGRIAGFAKGTVKGGWLITAAGDTAKKRGRKDDELFDAVDPDARYPLYGDRSEQEFEAESRYPVYLKAEKDGFQALLGDYDTGLTQTKLGRYARRMSGVRVLYEGEDWSFTGFAAETNQTFVRDEIAADGTSGPFIASTAPLVRNSESIVVETRDRFRPDIVRNATTLLRYLDYDIDFQTGELLFRLPVAASEDAQSYNVIVAEYETSAPVKRNVTAGGRIARRFLNGLAEVGVTGVHEQGPAGLREGGDLGAVDATVQLREGTDLRLEYALTRNDTPTGRSSADAFIAELTHTSDKLRANAFYTDTDAEFGLKHQSSAVVGVRRFGAELTYKFQELTGKKSGARIARFVDGKAYREENLTTGALRDVAEIGLRQENATTSAAVGLRGVVEEPETGPRRRALLSTLDFKQSFEKLGLTLRGERDQPLASDGDSTFFPKRTILGLDQRLWNKATLSVSHEIQEGEDASSSNTIVGVKADPWKGGSITVAGDMLTGDSGRRVGATFGIDQRIQISKEWTGSFGMSRRQDLDSDGVVDAPEDIVPDTPTSPLEIDRNFTSIYLGAGYQKGATTGSARFEHKKSEVGKRYTALLGAAREMNEALSFAGAARYEQNDNAASPDARSLDARFGAAWRPRKSDGLIIFNRFDVAVDDVDGAFNSWKAINNLAINYVGDPRYQISFNHGIKYAVLDDDFETYRGLTQLFGLETRYDISERIDFGLRGLVLYTHDTHAFEYAYGPSIGLTPADNIWFGFGWNIVGLRDDDFIAAEYAEKGPYIQLRVKFDQETARGLLKLISPEGEP
ncbi:MAG: hypothetical protein ABL957_08755 [Parvularculaceae bacterium]